MGYKVFILYFSTMNLPCSRPINENIKCTFLNLGSNIKDNVLWTFFSLYFFKRNQKSKTPQTLFMSKVKNPNSRTRMDSYSINYQKNLNFRLIFNFKQMEMAEFKTSLNNQWLLHSLKTQANTTGERTSTMIWDTCLLKEETLMYSS
jgi:hypothetical protein